ncbi:hypothetical protein BU17DRAFT_104188 [Hysterangium stoloniferum]|nr:hypothetical protein BU17DRAFT_104188 [Hysterangium stoloniferum]
MSADYPSFDPDGETQLAIVPTFTRGLATIRHPLRRNHRAREFPSDFREVTPSRAPPAQMSSSPPSVSQLIPNLSHRKPLFICIIPTQPFHVSRFP